MTRLTTPIWLAAKPTPSPRIMTSIMTWASFCRRASNTSTCFVCCLRTGSPMVRIRSSGPLLEPVTLANVFFTPIPVTTYSYLRSTERLGIDVHQHHYPAGTIRLLQLRHRLPDDTARPDAVGRGNQEMPPAFAPQHRQPDRAAAAPAHGRRGSAAPPGTRPPPGHAYRLPPAHVSRTSSANGGYPRRLLVASSSL